MLVGISAGILRELGKHRKRTATTASLTDVKVKVQRKEKGNE